MSDEVKLNAFYILLLNDIKLMGLSEENTFFVQEPSCAVVAFIYMDVVIIFFFLFCCGNWIVFPF